MSLISQMKADAIKLKADVAAGVEDDFPVDLLLTVFRAHRQLLIIPILLFAFGFIIGFSV